MVDGHDNSGFDRRSVLKTIGVGALGVAGATGASGSATADDSPDHYHNPVGPLGFGDVSIIDDGNGTYYAYGTETPQDIMPIAESTDLANWEYIAPVLEETPDWHPTEPDPGCWAPDVRYHNGQYHVYYSLSVWGSEDAGIGLATADSPDGPFTDQGPVIQSSDLDLTNCIDGDTILVDGQPWLVWGSWNGIYAVQMNDAMDDFVAGTEFQMAGDYIEGPVMLQDNGYFYLIYSTGQCCEGYDSTYRLEVGRSENFDGPYVNQDGMDLRDITDHHQGVPILEGDSYFTGPGHNDVYQDPNGNWWCFYHTEAHREDEERYMMVDRIQFDDDWPVIACNGTPSSQAPMPLDTFDCSAVQHHGGDPGGGTPDGDTISEGVYDIRNVSSNLAVTVGSAGTSAGSNIVQENYTGEDHQHFEAVNVGSSSYRLDNVNSGMPLEAGNGSEWDYGNIQQWSETGDPWQHWSFEEVDVDSDADTVYRVINDHSGLALSAGDEASGSSLYQLAYDSLDGQHWALSAQDDGDDGDGETDSVSVSTNDASDVSTDSATLNGDVTELSGYDSATVSVEYRETGASSWTATAGQSTGSTGTFSEDVSGLDSDTDYEFRAVADVSDDSATGATSSFATDTSDGGGDGGAITEGTYRVTNVNSGLFLEVANAGTADGDNVRQYSDTGHACQEWDVTENDDGTYTLTNANSGLFMEVGSADTSDGANVNQWADSGHACQHWDVEDAGSGQYRLVNDNSGKVAEVASAGTSDGDNVQQNADDGGDHQLWTFEPV